MKANRLMGKRLQLAYSLVAAGLLTDFEIAQRLGIKSFTLEEAKRRPYFSGRVAEIRQRIVSRAPAVGLVDRSSRVERLIDLAERVPVSR